MRIDPLEKLPEEVFCLILFQLRNPLDLEKCLKVSKAWKRLASNLKLWQNPELDWNEMFPQSQLPKANVKQYIDLCTIKSITELTQKIIKLSNFIPLNEHGIVRCHFAHDRFSIFQIIIGNPALRKKFEINFFVRKKLEPKKPFSIKEKFCLISLPQPIPKFFFDKIEGIINSRIKARLREAYLLELYL